MLPLWKTCARCGSRKTRWAFGKRNLPSGNTVLCSYDKDCARAYKRTWYQRRAKMKSFSPPPEPSQ